MAKNFLLHHFEHVTLVEQSPRLLAGAPAYILPAEEPSGAAPETVFSLSSSSAPSVVTKDTPVTAERLAYVCEGLQEFDPAPNSYDCIWIQWVVGHLHDVDCVDFYRYCNVLRNFL